VAMSPNATASQAESSRTFEVDGDTLVETWTNDAGAAIELTYTRVE